MQIGIGPGLCQAPTAAGAQPLPVLLSVAGQSNARKAGTSGQMPDAKYTGSLGDAYIWNAATAAWQAYVAGSNSGHQGGADNGVWGSEAEFLYQLRQAGDARPVYIVKECTNGQALAQVGGGDWSPASGGERYDGYVAQMTAALADLAAQGISGWQDVMLWNQGEADSNDPATAAAYGTHYSALRSALASDGVFPASGLWIFERIRPCTSDLATSPYSGQFTVREAQETAAAASATTRIISLDFDESTFASLHPGLTWTEGCGLRAYHAWRGTYDATFGAVGDDAPSNLSFADQSDVAPDTVITSETLVLAGIGGHADVTVADGEVRILNPDDTLWQDWTSGAATIHPYQRLQVRRTSASGLSAAASVTVTVGGVASTWTLTTYASAPSFEAETQAFIAQVAANGGGTIAGAQADALDAFYVAAKAGTWWAKMHRVYASLSDATASRLDLVGQAVSMVDTGGLPTSYWAWSAGTGWAGLDTANGGLDLNFDPSTAGLQDNQTVGVICSAFSAATQPLLVSQPDNQTYLRPIANTSLRGKVNQAGNTTSGAIGASGWVAAVRSDAASLDLYENSATPVDTEPDASVVPTDTSLEIGNSSGSYGDGAVQAAFVGEALTGAELLDLCTRLETLMASFAP